MCICGDVLHSRVARSNIHGLRRLGAEVAVCGPVTLLPPCVEELGVTVFRRIVFPNLVPAILSGAALGFARAVGEFGSVVLIAGNLPFKTEVASVFIFGRIESDAVTSAAAVSVVLLLVAFLVLLALRLVAGVQQRREEKAP